MGALPAQTAPLSGGPIAAAPHLVLAELCRESCCVSGHPLPTHAATFETVYRLASKLRSPHTLIIDDYHRDTSAITDYEIAELSRLSVPLHILVLARRLSVLDGPLVAGRNNLQLVTKADLAFTESEVTALIWEAGVERSRSIDRFFANLQGWPLAVAAALAAPRDTGQPALSSGVRAPVSRFEDNLGRFVLHQVEVMGAAARNLLLSAALQDSMSLELAAEFTGLNFDEASAALCELIERGMVNSITEHAPSAQTSPHGPSEFRCQAAMRPLLVPLAERAFDDEARAGLCRRRATELAVTVPVSAFLMFCETEAFAEAESLLIRYFGMLVQEKSAIVPALRAIPRAALLAHPALTSARLFLETDSPEVPPATLNRLTVLLRRGVTHQLVACAVELGFWPAANETKFSGLESLTPAQSIELLRSAPLPLLAQAMTSARLLGDRQGAYELASKLELRVAATPMHDASLATEAPPHPGGHELQGDGGQSSRWTTLLYLHEIALTASDQGDFVQAHRVWAKLNSVAADLVAQPRREITAATNLTEMDVQTGQRWLLVALQGQAFTASLEGDLATAAQLLQKSDELAAHSGLLPPGPTWLHGAVTRAAIAAETGATDVLAEQASVLTLLCDRIEPWALLIIAEATAVQRDQGAQWALQHLEASLRLIGRQQPQPGEWRVRLAAVQAQLYSATGNFAAASKVISRMPSEHLSTAIERARMHLFSGNELQAIRITAAIGNSGTTLRQRTDRCLIRSVAAWQSGHAQEAEIAFGSALEHLRESALQSPLWGVPFDQLHSISDHVSSSFADRLLAEVPKAARAARYEKLTEMELRTLQTVADHGTTAATADAMFVTLATVKKHLNSVYRKLRVRNRAEALLQASRMGLLQ